MLLVLTVLFLLMGSYGRAGQGFPSKCIEPGGWDVIEVVREDQMDAAFVEYESSTTSTRQRVSIRL